jgi:DNA-binding NarL/FixJ family response regulator
MSPSSRYRILIIDDESMFVRSMERLLREVADVASEDNVDGVQRRLRAGERYDIIVCDLTMAQMNGVDLYEGLVAEFPEVRESFVFASGGAEPSVARRVRATGRPLLQKPVSRDAVLALFRLR